MSIGFHRLVKPIYINRLIFHRFYCFYLLDSMIYFHRLGMPGFNQGHSSCSNNSLIRDQHHVWREQFRESRETFQKTFEHIVFVSLASTPKQPLKNNFFRLFQHLAAVFIRTSYTISRGCLTLRNFSVVKPKKSVIMFNSLTQDEVF